MGYSVGIVSSIGSPIIAAAVAPSIGFSVERLGTITVLTDCNDAARQSVDSMNSDVPSFLDAPLRLQFGDPVGAAHRGTVIGNLVLFGVVACVAVVALQWWKSRQQRNFGSHKPLSSQGNSFTECAASLRLPGFLIVPVALLLDSLISSSTLLFGYGQGPTDTAIGVVGVMFTLLPMISLAYVLDPRAGSFHAIPFVLNRKDRQSSARSSSSALSVLTTLWSELSTPLNEWKPRRPQQDNREFVEHFGHLFEDCRGGCHWWLLVEVSTTIFVSVMSGIVPESEDACKKRAWVVFGMCCVVLCACILVRPLSSTIDLTVSILLLAAQVVVLLCGILGVDGVADAVSLGVSVTSVTLALFPIVEWAAQRMATLRPQTFSYLFDGTALGPDGKYAEECLVPHSRALTMKLNHVALKELVGIICSFKKTERLSNFKKIRIRLWFRLATL